MFACNNCISSFLFYFFRCLICLLFYLAYPKSRQSHDATIDKLESSDTVPIKPSIKILIIRGIVIIVYLLLGALVFRELEYKKRDKKYWSRQFEKERENLFTYHNMTEEYLVKLGALLEKTNFEKHHTHKEWDFYQSLYFASTVTTTIGK